MCIVKYCIQWVSILGLLLLPVSGAQTVHIAHCMAGCPERANSAALDNNQVVVRRLFAASINSENGLADWLAYRVLADSVGVASLLPRAWYEDELLARNSTLSQLLDSAAQIVQSELIEEEERSYQINEITILSEDQGRLVPMSSFAGTPYWSELNYLSNMAPLPSNLRLGSWSRLDQVINELADRVGEVFVVSGPVYRIVRNLSTDVQTDMQSPAAYFKVIATASSATAFIFEHNLPQHAAYCEQISSIENIESETEFELFPQQQNSIQSSLNVELACDP